MARNRTLIGTDGLDRLKFDIASELVPRIRVDQTAKVPLVPAAPGGLVVPQPADFDQLKFEIAHELGIPLQPGYNGMLPARDAGRIGGKIGGNMVRRLIQIAEEAMASGRA
ncbi:MAG TPA: alpha/beta-type small acid-soluble spore protein [Bacillota bacterium]